MDSYINSMWSLRDEAFWWHGVKEGLTIGIIGTVSIYIFVKHVIPDIIEDIKRDV